MPRTNVVLASLFICLSLSACTSTYQIRGTEQGLGTVAFSELVGKDPEHKALQTALEHQSVEDFGDFQIGVIEVTDDGFFNPSQKTAVIDLIKKRHSRIADGRVIPSADPGLLVVFVHGWHHGARVCDRDLACFRSVLSTLKAAGVADGGNVTGLYVGWRGESMAYRGINLATIWDRKRVANHIGRTAGRELFTELDEIWKNNTALTMVTVGHSLGGQFVYSAVKAKLTGNVSDIELEKVRTYRVVRTETSRPDALAEKKKAMRARFGDLLVLVNPALEASDYTVFDRDLMDTGAPSQRDDLVKARLPYDKHEPYQDTQLPILVTLASEKDSAVRVIFPVAMTLKSLFTLRWTHFGFSYLKGLGHYKPFITHRLELKSAPEVISRAPMSASCGCSKNYGLGEPSGTLDLSSLKPQLDNAFFLTPERLARGWDPRSPYAVIQTTENVISEHSDIFNSNFVGFLRKYLTAYIAARQTRGVQRSAPQAGR